MRRALMVYGCREGREAEQGIQCPFVTLMGLCSHPLIPDEMRSISLHMSGFDDERGVEAAPAPDWCPLRDRPLTLHRYGGEP